MKIADLIQLLSNRLREFTLSRDYARMSGDLERMNVADKEIIALEDTLYQLNLLVDTSKSAALRETTLAEVITDGSIAVLGEYDITRYATDPEHEEKIMNILSKMGVMDTVEKIDDYIRSKALGSPVTGEMVMSASLAYIVDARLMMAILEQDSHFGTAGVAVSTLNPGNVGNDDDGNTRTYESWQEGVTAVAEWLNRHRGSTIVPEILEETVFEPTATSTPIITTSTTTTITTIPITSTTTPVTATSTPITATSTPPTATTTPVTATSTPSTSTSTPTTTATSTNPISSQSTPTASTSTEATADETADEEWQTTTAEETVTATSSGQATTTAN